MPVGRMPTDSNYSCPSRERRGHCDDTIHQYKVYLVPSDLCARGEQISFHRGY